ncbi:proteasome assembly chaperone family protein [Actinospongicola halichondriae]|uniref:proteasome assembly chaperone family protein n=1 Tax=Actinospongicola halichondriae TaxID=3236844 RepID=UPI003D4C743E
MPDLYELHNRPELDEPVLVVALEGWIDAGFGAGRAVETLMEQTDSVHVATFDADSLLDFRARRPIMHLVDGVNTGLTWSTTELHALQSDNGADILLLTGVEPDHAWHAFADAVRDLAVDLGARMQIGFGAFPSGVPHTRPVAISATASSDDLASSLGFVRGTIDVPAGVEAVIEQRFTEAGLPAVGVWAQVPHYAATMRYPAASARLIETLNQLAATDFGIGDLPDEIVEIRTRIDTLIADNPEHVAMLRQLEEQADETTQAQITDLPSGDDLAEELQQFLREQGD